jgi:hypothetical protein
MSTVPYLPPFWSDLPAVTDTDGTVLSPAMPSPPPVNRADVMPTVAQVAQLERTRCVDANGMDQGTFTAITHPSDTEVLALIDQAAAEVLGQLPLDIDTFWNPTITRLIALRTAVMIEISYYREQTGPGSPAGLWETQLQTELAAMQAAIPVATYIA